MNTNEHGFFLPLRLEDTKKTSFITNIIKEKRHEEIFLTLIHTDGHGFFSWLCVLGLTFLPLRGAKVIVCVHSRIKDKRNFIKPAKKSRFD